MLIHGIVAFDLLLWKPPISCLLGKDLDRWNEALLEYSDDFSIYQQPGNLSYEDMSLKSANN